MQCYITCTVIIGLVGFISFCLCGSLTYLYKQLKHLEGSDINIGVKSHSSRKNLVISGSCSPLPQKWVDVAM